MDLYCDGLIDTVSGGNGSGDIGATGSEGPSQAWPNSSVWKPYPISKKSATPPTASNAADYYIGKIKPTPSTFNGLSFDRADLRTFWISNTSAHYMPNQQADQAMPMAVLTESSPYKTNLKVSTTLLGGNAVPDNAYYCLDSPLRMVRERAGFKTPTTSGLHPVWTILTSPPDIVDGSIQRFLQMRCVVVGAAHTDSDGDCLGDAFESSNLTNMTNPDFDGDLLPDGLEKAAGTCPILVDPDNDGATDFVELFQFTRPGAGSNGCEDGSLVPCTAPVAAFNTSNDTDCDGFKDRQYDLLGFTVAAQYDTSGGSDNCPSIANTDQLNTDARPYQNSDTAFSDVTNPAQDIYGDACDADADNDLLPNVAEAQLRVLAADPGTGNQWCIPMDQNGPGNELQPLESDTDGDGLLDGIECLMNADPTDALSIIAAAGGLDPDLDLLFAPNVSNELAETFFRTQGIALRVGRLDDIDGDGLAGPADRFSDADGDLKDGVEVRFHQTRPTDVDSDADGCPDLHELADVVGSDRKVNSGDLGFVASKFGDAIDNVSGQYFMTHWNADVNKDGTVNSGDQGVVTAFFSKLCSAQQQARTVTNVVK
jgi:hypothetical protein